MQCNLIAHAVSQLSTLAGNAGPIGGMNVSVNHSIRYIALYEPKQLLQAAKHRSSGITFADQQTV
jgi:hypothetical protein